jgi:Flp pilus assembly protein TadD
MIRHLARKFGLVSLMVLWGQLDGTVCGADAPDQKLRALLGEVQSLQARHQYVDALLKLEELEKTHPDSADLYNIRGSILLSPGIRNFDEAETAFQKAESLQPGGLAPLFNLAEVSFVKHDWAEAKRRFEKVRDAFPAANLAVRHLIMFKLVMCELKLEQVAAAEAIIASQFTFMDDTPAYYLSKAAVAFQKKDEAAANEWVDKARAIFGENQTVSYVDSLMEARWVVNIGLPPAPGTSSK